MTTADFDLSDDDLRVVVAHVATTAETLLGYCTDPRPRAAVDAAWLFVGGARRSSLQRSAATDAHRAAAAASTEISRLAAQAAGDAAAAAYLHPIARAAQVGHILRADANAARIAEITGGGDPDAAHAVIARTCRRAAPALIGILARYPPAPTGRGRVAELMSTLDSALRGTP